LRGAGETLLLDGSARKWLVRLGPEGFDWEQVAAGDASVTVSGSPADLYLFVWGRRSAGALTVAGDRELLDRWRVNSAI
ncbi:MAG: maleylpyruvate isomerase family mycothiol-dependent enzyme, partial [Stackebrandtia sp.]